MAKDIKQSLKQSTDLILEEGSAIDAKLEGIANLKSAASVFSRRTNQAVGVTVDIIKSVPLEDRIFLKEYNDPKNGRQMVEKTIIDSSISMGRVFSKQEEVYIQAGQLYVERSVSTDYFVYVGDADNGNPLFELRRLDVNDKMYKKTKDNPTPPKATSTILKPRINREDIQRYYNDPTQVLPNALRDLIVGEVVTKRTTRHIKK